MKISLPLPLLSLPTYGELSIWYVFLSFSGSVFSFYCVHKLPPLSHWLCRRIFMALRIHFSSTSYIMLKEIMCCVDLRCSSPKNTQKRHTEQTAMTIWRSGGSEMLTRCVLLFSGGYLVSRRLPAPVGWAALARRGGSSRWCQRKSCPPLRVSFVGPMFSYLKKKEIKRETQRRLFTVLCCDADIGACGRAAWATLEMQLSSLWFRGSGSD